MLKKSASGVLPRHCRLTDSQAHTQVTLFLHRVADLAAVLPDDLFEHPEVLFWALALYGSSSHSAGIKPSCPTGCFD